MSKLDKVRDKIEKQMYKTAVIMAEEPYNLSYSQIRENFELSVDDVIEMLDIQYPEISDNDYDEWTRIRIAIITV